MCHYDAPAGSSPAPVVREEVRIPLPEGQELPAFLARPERGDGAPQQRDDPSRRRAPREFSERPTRFV